MTPRDKSTCTEINTVFWYSDLENVYSSTASGLVWFNIPVSLHYLLASALVPISYMPLYLGSKMTSNVQIICACDALAVASCRKYSAVIIKLSSMLWF